MVILKYFTNIIQLWPIFKTHFQIEGGGLVLGVTILITIFNFCDLKKIMKLTEMGLINYIMKVNVFFKKG